jgi:hypothetical protein
MEMNQIRYFLKAGETLNFTRAAEQCGVSVPSLSRGIRLLEEELGGQLFRRERHLTHLTDLGRLMLAHFSIMSRARPMPPNVTPRTMQRWRGHGSSWVSSRRSAPAC